MAAVLQVRNLEAAILTAQGHNVVLILLNQLVHRLGLLLILLWVVLLTHALFRSNVILPHCIPLRTRIRLLVSV